MSDTMTSNREIAVWVAGILVVGVGAFLVYGGPPGPINLGLGPNAPKEVRLLTYDDVGPPGCYTNASALKLVPDPLAGVAMLGTPTRPYASGDAPIPVAWPKGYWAVKIGDQVEVHSPSGLLVAVTGRYYYIAARPNAENSSNLSPFPICVSLGLTQWDPNSTPPPG